MYEYFVKVMFDIKIQSCNLQYFWYCSLAYFAILLLKTKRLPIEYNTTCNAKFVVILINFILLTVV